MERVPFNVAKALKDAGYPQTLEEDYDVGYAITKVTYQEYDSFDGTWYTYTASPGIDLIFNNKNFYPENCGEFCVAPYYLDVWLWLWREKKINVTPEYDQISGLFSSCGVSEREDPEEAIKQAVDYLVEQKLINP